MRLTKTQLEILSEISQRGRTSIDWGYIAHSGRSHGSFGGRRLKAACVLECMGLVQTVARHNPEHEAHRGRTNVFYSKVIAANGCIFPMPNTQETA